MSARLEGRVLNVSVTFPSSWLADARRYRGVGSFADGNWRGYIYYNSTSGWVVRAANPSATARLSAYS